MCFFALATSSATGRCCSLGTVRITPFTSGWARSVFRSGVTGTPNSRWNAWRFSTERLKPATISSLPELLAARVSTRAQRPSPTMPSFTGEVMVPPFYNASFDPQIGELDRPPGVRCAFVRKRQGRPQPPLKVIDRSNHESRITSHESRSRAGSVGRQADHLHDLFVLHHGYFHHLAELRGTPDYDFGPLRDQCFFHIRQLRGLDHHRAQLVGNGFGRALGNEEALPSAVVETLDGIGDRRNPGKERAGLGQ